MYLLRNALPEGRDPPGITGPFKATRRQPASAVLCKTNPSHMPQDSSTKKTPAVLIIACGNPNRADDTAGMLAAARLCELGIAVRICGGGAPDLMEAWSAADNVIVIDCVVTGAAPGTVQIWDASRPLPLQRSSSTHGIGLAEAVELARAIGCLPARLRIYGIEGKNFEVGGAVSAEVKEGVSKAVGKIAAEAGKGN